MSGCYKAVACFVHWINTKNDRKLIKIYSKKAVIRDVNDAFLWIKGCLSSHKSMPFGDLFMFLQSFMSCFAQCRFCFA